MNILDVIFLVIIGFFFIRGLMRGLVIELAGVIGAVGGFFLANGYYTELSPYIYKYVTHPGWAGTLAYLAIFIATMMVVTFISQLANKLIPKFAAWINSTLGGLFGLLKGGVVCLVAFTVMNHFLPHSELVTESKFAPHLEPTATYLEQYIPEGLEHLPPLPLPEGSDSLDAPDSPAESEGPGDAT